MATALRPPKIGSLFSGVAGLDRAVEQFFGAEVAFFVEFDSAPSKVLAHRYPGVPNYGDVTKTDFSKVGPIDILSLGFPCQDVSLAGARRGLRDGTRSGLWSEAARAIDILRPKLVVIENVRGLLSAQTIEEVEDAPDSDSEHGPAGVGEPPRGDRPVLNAFGRVLLDLAELGYDAEWVGLRAADAGAPHNRFRVFCVAYPRGEASGLGSGLREGESSGLGRGRSDDDGVQAPPADAGRDESERWGRAGDLGGASGSGETDGAERERVRDAAGDRGSVAADSRGLRGDESYGVAGVSGEGADGAGVADERGSRPGGTEWGVYKPAIERWEGVVGRVAPAPTRPDGRDGGRRLNPELTEWMMGWPASWVTDPAIGLTRNEQLKACGNGVVTQQAYLALSVLMGRAA